MAGKHQVLGMATAVVLAAGVSAAAGAEDFYKGKSVNLIVSAGAGGGYDTYARAFGRFFFDHIPGKPSGVVQNMPGAGGLRATNFIYSTAPKDGLTIGTVHNSMTMAPLFRVPQADFEPVKFSWIGNLSSESTICVAWHTSPVKTAKDLFEKPFIVGSTGAGANMSRFPKVMNAAVGTKIRVIEGYTAGGDVVLAMERGEVEGRCGWTYSGLVANQGDKFREGKINILLQAALQKDPNIPDVPLVTEFVKSEQEKAVLRLIFATNEIGRPVFGPPGVPAERLAALRAGFDATMKDEAFLKFADANHLEIRPTSGAETLQLVEEFYRMPKDIVERARALLSEAEGPKKK